MNVRGGQKIFLAFCAFAAIFSVMELYRFNQGSNNFSGFSSAVTQEGDLSKAALLIDRLESLTNRLSFRESVKNAEGYPDLFQLGPRIKSQIELRIWVDVPNDFPWRKCLSQYNGVAATTQCSLKSNPGSTWRIPDWGAPNFQIVNMESKQCLEPGRGEATTNIAQAVIKDCSEGRWGYNVNGQLSWGTGEGCLTSLGSPAGNRVELHPCNNTLQQQRFEFGTLDTDTGEAVIIPLDISQWEDRQRVLRERELVEAKADVLKTLVEHTDQSSEKRRAVVFYLDRGTGFLAFLNWWILAWKLLGLNSLTEKFDIILFTHPDSVQYLPKDCIEYRANETRLTGAGKCLFVSMYGIAYRDSRYDNYINSHECLINPKAEFLTQYSHILRSDLDTFPTPGLLGYWPDAIIANKYMGYTFRNSSGISLITEQLKEAAEYLGLTHKGMHDIGSSWFGPAHLVIKLSSMTVALSKYLRVYMFGPGTHCRCATCTELPLQCTWGEGPYAGTVLLYAQEIAINQVWDQKQYDSLKKGYLDLGTTSSESVCSNLHLHVFHNPEIFSKFDFMAGKYKELDMSGLKLSKTRDYAVYLALKSSGQGKGEKEVTDRYSIGEEGSLANVCKIDGDNSSV